MLVRWAALGAVGVVVFFACSSEEGGGGSTIDDPGSGASNTGGATSTGGGVAVSGGTTGSGAAVGTGGDGTGNAGYVPDAAWQPPEDAGGDQPQSYTVDACTPLVTQITCSCPDGRFGLATCNAQGTAFMPCDCDLVVEDSGTCAALWEECASRTCCEGQCNVNAEGTTGIVCCWITMCTGPGQCCNGTSCSSAGECCSETGGTCTDSGHCCNNTDSCIGGLCVSNGG